jgi:hypothetical protein
MTVGISPVFLFSPQSGQSEAAELWDAITEKQLADWEGEWVPELFKAVQRLKRAGVERKHWPQSRHWDWRRKTEALQGMLANPGFSVVCAGVTQGMMLVDTTMKRCRLESQKGKNLVYVSFVETAPWNRKELLFDPPRYRGVGAILIRAAIELSKEAEFKGRMGLHSLPQANSFYANVCGMTDLGADQDYQGLRYFEMSPEQAEAFIKKGGKT